MVPQILHNFIEVDPLLRGGFKVVIDTDCSNLFLTICVLFAGVKPFFILISTSLPKNPPTFTFLVTSTGCCDDSPVSMN